MPKAMTLLPEAKRLGWPIYPHPWQYRNPYVKVKRRSRKPPPTCMNCGRITSRDAPVLRCQPCAGINRRGTRSNNTTTPRVLAAAKSGKFTTQTCVATEVGITRERVRQILNAAGNTEFGHRVLRLECLAPTVKPQLASLDINSQD